jgi:hypothetical protein
MPFSVFIALIACVAAQVTLPFNEPKWVIVNSKENVLVNIAVPINTRVHVTAKLTVPWYVVDIEDTSTKRKMIQTTDFNTLGITLEPSLEERIVSFNTTYHNFRSNDLVETKMKFEVMHEYVAVHNINTTEVYSVPQTEQYSYFTLQLAGKYSIAVASSTDIEVIVSQNNYPTGDEKTQYGSTVLAEGQITNATLFIGIRKASFCTSCTGIQLEVAIPKDETLFIIAIVVLSAASLWCLVVTGLSLWRCLSRKKKKARKHSVVQMYYGTI